VVQTHSFQLGMSSGLAPLSLKAPNAVYLNTVFVQEPWGSPHTHTAKRFWSWRDREGTVVLLFLLEEGGEAPLSRVQALYLVCYPFFLLLKLSYVQDN